MKFAVLNYSGNVGKTTIARDILKYNLPDFRLISVESVNQDGQEEVLIKGENGDLLLAEMLLNDQLIIDVGSSNLEGWFNNVLPESDIFRDINLFVIPVAPGKKQQMDTLKTVEKLINSAVDKDKLFFICNFAEINEGENNTFSHLTKMLSKEGIKIDPRDKIFRHDLYNGKPLKDLISKEDYREQMEEAKARGESDLARQLAFKHIKQRKLYALNELYQQIFGRMLEKVEKQS